MMIYYAHCMAIYNKPQEKEDIEILKKIGFDVLNPNSPLHSNKVNFIRGNGGSGADVMEYFKSIVESDEIDALAFRALPDGSIPAGVAKEIDVAMQCGKPVIELPYHESRKKLTVQETRTYLKKVGQR